MDLESQRQVQLLRQQLHRHHPQHRLLLSLLADQLLNQRLSHLLPHRIFQDCRHLFHHHQYRRKDPHATRHWFLRLNQEVRHLNHLALQRSIHQQAHLNSPQVHRRKVLLRAQLVILRNRLQLFLHELQRTCLGRPLLFPPHRLREPVHTISTTTTW